MSSLCKRAVCLSQKKVGEKNCFFKILWHLIFSCLYLNTINKLIFYFVVCNLVISFRSLFRITCHSFLGSDLLLGFSCFFFYELLYHYLSLFILQSNHCFVWSVPFLHSRRKWKTSFFM